ncbi:MAG: lamin tail domain-containing protein [Pseudomonadota bacterium]
MADIYQRIWTADQEQNGIEALWSGQTGDDQSGFVKVNADLDQENNPDLRVLTEVKIPAAKSGTYDKCRQLFDNYALPEGAHEVDTDDERAERHAFIEAIIDTPPMRVARDYIAEQTDTDVSNERWHNTLMDHWFRRFEQGGDPHLSGFEHVVVGEQEGGKVQGYHFWYKYFLDDGFAHLGDDERRVLPGFLDQSDRIRYVRSKAKDGQDAFPESVTIQFAWDAPDYDAMALRPLHKKIGGFFVGCSVEGLMALGTVRAHLGANAPKTAVIEGARYRMRLFRSANNRHIRTFYPVFQGPADPVIEPGEPVRPPAGGGGVVPGNSGDVRIIAAFVNPAGHDPGRENVTIVHTGPDNISVKGWKLRDKNGNSDTIGNVELEPGLPHTVVLSGKGGGAQLSNKGSTISLVRTDGTVVHQVQYSKAQARAENKTILFV